MGISFMLSLTLTSFPFQNTNGNLSAIVKMVYGYAFLSRVLNIIVLNYCTITLSHETGGAS